MMKTRILSVLLALSIVAAGYSAYRWYATSEGSQTRAQILAAARQFTVDFVTMTAATVDQDLARVALSATGEFGEEFARGMPAVRTAVQQNQVRSNGTVISAGIVSSDQDSAVVLVAIDATVRNVKAPDGRLSHYRIQLDMALAQGGAKWLVSRLQFVG